MKTFLLITNLLFSVTNICHADEKIRIISSKKFKVLKEGRITQVYQVDANTKKEILIFHQMIRDSIQWIFSSDNDSRILLVSRPMIADSEKSSFWLISNKKSKKIGVTTCRDHKIDDVNLKYITYTCFIYNKSNPLSPIVVKKVFSVNENLNRSYK